MNPKPFPLLLAPVLALALALLWHAPRVEAATPDYNVTDMGSGGFMNYLNDHGEAVGYRTIYDTPSRAVLLLYLPQEKYGLAAGRHELEIPVAGGRAYGLTTRGINNAGQIVGTWLRRTTTNSERSFLWDKGTFIDRGTDIRYIDINNNGDILGTEYIGTQYVVSVWPASGGVIRINNTPFGPPGSTSNNYITYKAVSINDSGLVLVESRHEYRASNNDPWINQFKIYTARNGAIETVIDIGGPPALYGGSQTYANHLNNKGQATGRDNSGGWLYLPEPDYGLAAGVHIMDPYLFGVRISDPGLFIVDWTDGTLWDKGPRFNVADGIDPGSGWDVAGLYDVNNSGQVLARAWLGGQPHYALLTPEPTLDAIVVNATGDEEDADPDDGRIDTDPIAAGDQVTLRAAINFANSAERPGPDTIHFDFEAPSPGITSISPLVPLPTITESLTIDGTTQPGSGRVWIRGTSAIGDGLKSIAAKIKVSGMLLTEFSGAAISIDGGSDHRIKSCVIGTDPAESSGLGNGIGIKIRNALGTIIGGLTSNTRNIISANVEGIDAANSSSLSVIGNLIGTKMDGMSPLPNTERGIIADTITDLIVGTSEIPTVVNAKTGGLLKNVTGTVKNIMFNLSVDGTTALGTTMETGLCIEDSDDVTVGGSAYGERNVFAAISGDAFQGLRTTLLKIQTNLIGTAADGTTPLPVGGNGIFASGCTGLEVGRAASPTIINAKTGGLFQNVTGTVKNIMFNLALDGTPLGTTMETGLRIEDSQDVTVGGAAYGERNVFAAISGDGIQGINSILLKLQSNLIGTDAYGGIPLPIGGNGIFASGCTGLEVGKAAAPTIINAKTGGLFKDITGKVQNIMFNLALDGTTPLGTTMETGLCIEDSEDVTVGGEASGERNVFAAISGDAVQGLRSIGLKLQSILIGTAANGITPLPVGGNGIFASGCTGLEVGKAAAPTIINAKTGGLFKNVTGTVKNIMFNLALNGTTPLGTTMETGLCIEDSEDVTVGGEASGERNVFAAISGDAVQGLRSIGLKLQSNLIGTAANGITPLPVGGNGIFASGCTGLEVGKAAAPTIINAKTGGLFRNITGNVKNIMFNLALDGTTPLGTTMETGLCIEDSEDVTVGGEALNEGNVFAGIRGNGLELLASKALQILSNRFGTLSNSSVAAPNTGDNILVSGASVGVSIAKNSIQNAGLNGVQVTDPTSQVDIRFNQIIKSTGAAIVRALGGPSTVSIAAMRGSTHVEGTVAGRPNEELIIDFYAYEPLAANVESDLFIGTLSVTLDSGGFGSYAKVFSNSAPRGWRITAAITDSITGTAELATGQLIATAPDSDGDGLPDFYEQLHVPCLNLLVFNAPDEDCDHDGQTNLQEYAAGTDPTVASAPISPTIMEITQGGFTVSIPALSARIYTLERYSPDQQIPWNPVATSGVTTMGGSINLTDQASPSDSALYRVRIEVD